MGYDDSNDHRRTVNFLDGGTQIKNAPQPQRDR
jgi:hypothetical protein